MIYYFTGKVLPERTNVEIYNMATIECDFKKLHLKINISIRLSQISITVEADQKIEDIYTLKNVLQSEIDAVLDIYGYLTGRGYGCEITSVVNKEENLHIIFGVGIPDLEVDETERLPYQEIFGLIYGNSSLVRCLRISLFNFKLAIRYPADTGFYCYRAIESVRNAFGKDKSGWESMHSKLGTSETNIRLFKEKHSDEQRHGGITEMTGEERVQMLKVARLVIDKFINYAKDQS
jgi:hypothetical protein